ncbi:protein adenylyltransferase SelO family protein [uncultured Shimia sp.]|uniref:protein adenylyltransferase SelO n=1 Tax=uncultured Shimia sp. TaxID=573152 RepID=UPI002601B383|nr:YdiU family protein [uncultured Shimia sp.]
MLHIPFDNSYARLPASLFTRQNPEPVKAPELLAFNHSLARDLGISGDQDIEELATVFSGNAIPDGAEPLAQLYAGHQFGHWNPQLGDGRAILLGEVQGRDIQLKGSGRTPYSRNGDGRAWVGPVLREFVVSEAMHALGIPTTRALAAVATGEMIQRETALPGAVLTRVAASHIRVGTFQALAARQDYTGLQALFDHARDRHDPEAKDPLEFLNGVIERQAQLVTKWMNVGFIHGVMNTDNCSISGETIDYGPCAFMDSYDPMTVFSSIDRQGRYAWGRQADIIVWNMAQLATALVPLMPDQDDAITKFTSAVHAMPERLNSLWNATLLRKIGISDPRSGDLDLAKQLLTLMAAQSADFTNTFAALASDTAGDHFVDREAFEVWAKDWRARLKDETAAQDTMRAANPLLIPRNHRIEEMIQAAVSGDMAPFSRLMQAYDTPFEVSTESRDLTHAPLDGERVHATFCGT